MATRKAFTRNLTTGATTTAALLYFGNTYFLSTPIQNESPTPPATVDANEAPELVPAVVGNKPRGGYAKVGEAEKHAVWVWGSNKNATIQPSLTPTHSALPPLKTPRPTHFLPPTPLRHLSLHETYSCAIDASGDLLMWGDGYDPTRPTRAQRSLRNRDLCTVACASEKVYALGRKSGVVYGVPAKRVSQVGPGGRGNSGERDPWWYLGLGSWLRGDPGVDHVKLEPAGGLKRGEKFSQISAGRHHLLALTNKGRTFSMPISPEGNAFAQLGTRVLPPLVKVVPPPAGDATSGLTPYTDIRYNTTLTPISSLESIEVAQVACGDRNSFIRTAREGRVLGWGANESGQIGLGSMTAVETVPTPTEIVLARGYPGGTTLRCLDVAAGGNNTFFTVIRSAPGAAGLASSTGGGEMIDLLAVGNGLTGMLGNGMWSSAMGSAVKVKTVSGLQEYSEAASSYVPLHIQHVSVSPSPTPHAIATLRTVALSESQGVTSGQFGNDVFLWGSGGEYQLGNGKRSNLAVAQHLPPLQGTSRGLIDAVAVKEASLGSGTISPMPHSRLQLHTGLADAYDVEGKRIKKGCKVEEVIHAGYNSSAVYWRIVD